MNVVRRSPTKLRELARQVIQREVIVTDNPRVLQSAFYCILPFVELAPREAEKIGAVIGYNNNVVPGRAMNGYPIYLSCSFLHLNDVDRFNAIMDEMEAALA